MTRDELKSAMKAERQLVWQAGEKTDAAERVYLRLKKVEDKHIARLADMAVAFGILHDLKQCTLYTPERRAEIAAFIRDWPDPAKRRTLPEWWTLTWPRIGGVTPWGADRRCRLTPAGRIVRDILRTEMVTETE